MTPESPVGLGFLLSQGSVGVLVERGCLRDPGGLCVSPLVQTLAQPGRWAGLSSRFPRISAAAQVAQLVEQGTENPRVGGSNPSLGTILPARPLPSFRDADPASLRFVKADVMGPSSDPVTDFQ